MSILMSICCINVCVHNVFMPFLERSLQSQQRAILHWKNTTVYQEKSSYLLARHCIMNIFTAANKTKT